MHVRKIITAISASAALMLVGVLQPALAQPRVVITADSMSYGGGSFNCTGGCTITQLGNGWTQIDTADGESYLSDGTNVYGAP